MMKAGYFFFVRDWLPRTPKFVIKEVCNVDVAEFYRYFRGRQFAMFLNEKRHIVRVPQRKDKKPFTHYLELLDGENLTGLFEISHNDQTTLYFGYSDPVTRQKSANPLIRDYGQYVVVLDNQKRCIEVFAFNGLGSVRAVADMFKTGKAQTLIRECRRRCVPYQRQTLQMTLKLEI